MLRCSPSCILGGKAAGSRGWCLKLALDAESAPNPNPNSRRNPNTNLNPNQEQGALELVLDLRDNRGGLVSEGVEVARLFLDGALQRRSQMSARGPQCRTPRSH